MVCNSTSTSLASSLTCDVGSGEFNYRAQAFRRIAGSDDERRVGLRNVKVGNAYEIFGLEGFFWSFILLFTLIIVGIYSPPVGILLYAVGTILLGATQIIYMTPTMYIVHIAIAGLFWYAFKT